MAKFTSKALISKCLLKHESAMLFYDGIQINSESRRRCRMCERERESFSFICNGILFYILKWDEKQKVFFFDVLLIDSLCKWHGWNSISHDKSLYNPGKRFIMPMDKYTTRKVYVHYVIYDIQNRRFFFLYLERDRRAMIYSSFFSLSLSLGRKVRNFDFDQKCLECYRI